MSKIQTSTLISLIKRSEDIGNGWRECSEICWGLLEDIDNPELFDLDHKRKRVRIRSKPKDKPTMDDLLNQIYEWRERTIKQIRAAERHEMIRSKAEDMIFGDPS